MQEAITKRFTEKVADNTTPVNKFTASGIWVNLVRMAGQSHA